MLNMSMAGISFIDLPIDMIHLVCKQLSLKELANLRSTTTYIAENTRDIAQEKYKALFKEFLNYDTYYFDNLISNFLFLTVDMQARLYFEFLEQVLVMFTPVLIHNTRIVADVFHYICIFYDTLCEEERTYYKRVCLHDIARFLYIDPTIRKLSTDEKYNHIWVLYDLLDKDINETKDYTIQQMDEFLATPYYRSKANVIKTHKS